MTPGTVPTVHEAIGQAEGIERLAQRLRDSADRAVGPVGRLAAVDLQLDAERLARKLRALSSIVGDR